MANNIPENVGGRICMEVRICMNNIPETVGGEFVCFSKGMENCDPEERSLSFKEMITMVTLKQKFPCKLQIKYNFLQ